MLSLAAVIALAVGGCGSQGSAPRTAVAGWSQNHQTIHLHVGDRLNVTLDSTYFQIPASSDESVLAPDGPGSVQAAAPSDRCRPGVGCGTVSRRFRAVKAGAAVVNSHRDSCGEVLRCTSDLAEFQIDVIVDT